VTESMIFDKVAAGFGIENWPVTAVKAYVGHPLGPASGDQLANTLGSFADGIVTGISTIDKVASDVVEAATNGDLNVIYNFGNGIIEDHEINIAHDSLSISGYANPIDLEFDNPYSDMTS